MQSTHGNARRAQRVHSLVTVTDRLMSAQRSSSTIAHLHDLVPRPLEVRAVAAVCQLSNGHILACAPSPLPCSGEIQRRVEREERYS